MPRRQGTFRARASPRAISLDAGTVACRQHRQPGGGAVVRQHVPELVLWTAFCLICGLREAVDVVWEVP